MNDLPSPAKRLYPIALNLEGRRCLVVGGGNVALRKAQGLLRAGARVCAVAPEARPELIDLARDGRIELERRPFRPEDVQGRLLVFAATDRPDVNAWVVELGRRSGALANRSDDPAGCDFAGMSEVVRGSLLIAISTGADSPAFSRWIRRQVEERFGSEYGAFLEMAASLRPEVIRSLPDDRRGPAWEKALGSQAIDLLRGGDGESALACLRDALGLNDVDIENAKI